MDAQIARGLSRRAGVMYGGSLRVTLMSRSGGSLWNVRLPNAINPKAYLHKNYIHYKHYMHTYIHTYIHTDRMAYRHVGM